MKKPEEEAGENQLADLGRGGEAKTNTTFPPWRKCTTH